MLPLLLRLLPLLGAAVGALAAIGLVLLAYRRWRCERLMGERMARPPEWPLLGVAPHFIGKDNEGEGSVREIELIVRDYAVPFYRFKKISKCVVCNRSFYANIRDILRRIFAAGNPFWNLNFGINFGKRLIQIMHNS